MAEQQLANAVVLPDDKVTARASTQAFIPEGAQGH